MAPASLHLALISNASKVFTESELDLNRALNTVCELLATHVGDSVFLRLLTDDQNFLKMSACAHRDKKTTTLLRTNFLNTDHPVTEGLTGKAYRSNQLQLHRGEPDLASLPTTSKAYMWFFENIGFTSIVVAPLAVHGKVFGTLMVSRDRGSVAHTDDDCLLIQELATRAAMTVDHARLYAVAVQNHTQLQIVTNSIPAHVAYVDAGQIFRFNNSEYERSYGHPVREINGKPMRDVLGDKAYREIQAHVECALKGERVRFIEEPRTADPQLSAYRRTTFTPDFNDQHEVRGFVILSEDLSEQRQRELEREKLLKQVERESTHFRTLANSLPQLVWTVDGDGRVQWYNDRCYEYSGRSRTERHGLSWRMTIHPDDVPRFTQAWNSARAAGTQVEGEFLMLRHDGVYCSFLVRATPVLNADGVLYQWFATATDVDEQRRMRQALEEAIGHRDNFLSLASHELKTPLTSLKLQLQLAERSLPMQSTPSLVNKSLSIAIDQTEKIESLICDLLDIVRIQEGKLSCNFERATLGSLVARVATQMEQQLMAAECALRIQDNFSEFVECDPFRIEQVLANLLTNATKYAPARPIEITIERDPRVPMANVTVRDHGPGIPPDQSETIFNRFERLETSRLINGLGLGLYISREIMHAHQGSIGFQNAESGGCELMIKLPISQSKPLWSH